jgi:hypothetical protein
MVTMPYKAAAPVLGMLTIDTSTIPDIVKFIGLPIPVWCLDGRMGGFGFPFDLGFKIGYLPLGFQIPGTTNTFVDYLLVGADFRWAVIEGGLMLPSLSIGASANFLKGNAYFKGVTGGGTRQIASVAGVTVQATDPDVDFNWSALVFEAKAQASWNLAIFTPYLGTGLSYAPYATAGGGLQSNIQTDSGSPGTFHNITPADISMINAAYPGVFSNLSGSSFIVSATMPASWSIRAFGGFAFTIIMVKVDIMGAYNFLDGAFGLSANVRVQL